MVDKSKGREVVEDDHGRGYLVAVVVCEFCEDQKATYVPENGDANEVLDKLVQEGLHSQRFLVDVHPDKGKDSTCYEVNKGLGCHQKNYACFHVDGFWLLWYIPPSHLVFLSL